MHLILVDPTTMVMRIIYQSTLHSKFFLYRERNQPICIANMASKNEKIVVAFDLYGTILSTGSITRELSKQLNISEDKANEIATLARRYQLEYSWRLTSMSMILSFVPLSHRLTISKEKYKPFSEITLNSVHQALLELSISSPSDKSKLSTFNDSILKAYDSLSIFPDAKSALELLPSKKNVESYIFSNGTKAMLQSSIHESDDLKHFANLFKGIVSVEKTQVFKPAPEVYHRLVKLVGKNWENKEDVAKVWLISGNPFDVVGAKSVGMKACWVDRSGNGWTDRLMGDEEDFKPDLIVKGVKDAVEGVAGWYN